MVNLYNKKNKNLVLKNSVCRKKIEILFKNKRKYILNPTQTSSKHFKVLK
jgi:non-homologous end joining protein Ku